MSFRAALSMQHRSYFLRVLLGSLVLTALVKTAPGQDLRPVRVFRYRHAVTQAHGFTTNATPPAGYLGEDVPDDLAASPIFYLSTEAFTATVPVYSFTAPDGTMRLAATAAERQAMATSGLVESGPPLYLYDHQVEGASEVFRLVHGADGDIIYTTSPEEKDYYRAKGWVLLPSLGFAQAASSSGTGILRETTVKLLPEEVALLSRTVLRGEQLIFATVNPKIAALVPGTVVYAEKSDLLPLGLVARVTAVTQTSAGETQIDTAPADLHDAFAEFHLYLEGKQVYFIGPATATPVSLRQPTPRDARIPTPGPGRLIPEYLDRVKITTGVTLLPDGGTWSQTLTFSQDLYKKASTSGNASAVLHLDGNLSFDATAELVYNGYNMCVIKPTIMFLLSPHEHGNLTVTATGDLATQKETQILGPYTATFAVGGIPVSVDLNVYAGFTAAANVTASVTASEDAHLTAGVQYDLSSLQLSPIICPNPCPTGFTCGPTRVTGPTCTFTPSLTGSFSATAQVSVYVRPELYLYAGAWGTGIGPTGYTKLQLTAALEPPNLNVYAQLIPGVGARLQVAYCTVQQWGPKEFDPWVNVKLASFPLVLPPTVTALKINNGATTTTARAVTLNNTTTNNPTQYLASESSSFVGATWQAYSAAPTFSITSASGGTKTIYFKAKNTTGESSPANASITLVLAPSISSFTINNGANSTTSRTVTLTNTATNTPAQYLASESSSFVGATWQAYTTSPTFTLSATGGTKTVYFKVQNAAGTSTAASATINLVVAPTITSFRINNGATTTTSRAVTLNNTTTNNPTQYMAAESSSFAGATWQTYSTAPTFTLSAAKGTKTIYLKVQNAAGTSPVQTAQITLK